MPGAVDPQWYRKPWTLDIEDMSWVEHTPHEVNFVVEALQLQGGERILDLACGFGRHALELASRGYPVVGVDLTAAYVEEARKRATERGLPAEFICADVRDVSFRGEFDVALNLADSAIGYLENEEENLRVFDRIAAALKPGGKHLMGVCNAAYARKHFPRRHWESGSRSISLADFGWDSAASRMLYSGYMLKYGEPLIPPEEDRAPASIRLYGIDELREVFHARGMEVRATYGGYDTGTPASDDQLALLVYSEKVDK